MTRVIKRLTESEVENILEDITQVVTYLSREKIEESFIPQYLYSVSNRLLHQKSISVEYEFKLGEMIDPALKFQGLIKGHLKVLIDDISSEVSTEIAKFLHENDPNLPKLSLKILSDTTWPYALTLGPYQSDLNILGNQVLNLELIQNEYIHLSPPIEHHWYLVKSVYNSFYPGKKLYLLPHLSGGELCFTTSKGNKITIHCTVEQMRIFHFFEDANELTFDELLEKTKYKKRETNKSIKENVRTNENQGQKRIYHEEIKRHKLLCHQQQHQNQKVYDQEMKQSSNLLNILEKEKLKIELVFIYQLKEKC